MDVYGRDPQFPEHRYDLLDQPTRHDRFCY
jgi:hypothetical protein